MASLNSVLSMVRIQDRDNAYAMNVETIILKSRLKS